MAIEGRTGELTTNERAMLDSAEQASPTEAAAPRSVLEGRLASGTIWRLTVTRTAEGLCFRSTIHVDNQDGTGYGSQFSGCHPEPFTASGGRSGERGPQAWHGPLPAGSAAVQVVAADGATGQGFAYSLREVGTAVFVAFVDCTETIAAFVAQDTAGATVERHEMDPRFRGFLRCD